MSDLYNYDKNNKITIIVGKRKDNLTRLHSELNQECLNPRECVTINDKGFTDAFINGSFTTNVNINLMYDYSVLESNFDLNAVALNHIKLEDLVGLLWMINANDLNNVFILTEDKIEDIYTVLNTSQWG